MILDNIDTDSAVFWFFSGLITVIGALIIHIHLNLVKKVDAISQKIDRNEERNQADHAKVDASLARLEQAIHSIDRDIQRHERDIEDLREIH